MKKYIYVTLLSLGMLQVSQAHALDYGTNPAEAFISTQIEIPAHEKLTNILINPTFTNQYAELLIPKSVIKKIQTSLKTTPVNITTELTTTKNTYKVIFTAKTNAGKTVATKTFTNIMNKNHTTIPTNVSYIHTNVKYQINDGAYTEIKLITKNPFTISVSIAK